MKHTLHRLGAACALTVIAVGAAAPAFAAERPRLSVDAWNQVNLAPGQSEGERARLTFSGAGSGRVTGVVMTIDTSAAAGLAEVTSHDCERSGAILTCAVNDFDYAEGEFPSLDEPYLNVTALAGVNGVAKLPVTVTADNAETSGGSFTIRVAEAVTFAYPETTHAAGPGEAVELRIPVVNSGDTTIYNPVLQMEMDGALPDPLPANCEDHMAGADVYSSWLTCRFDAVIAPGKSGTVTMPWKVRADVLGPITSSVSWWGNDGGPAGAPIPGLPRSPAQVPVQHAFEYEGFGYDTFLSLTSGGKTDLVAVSAKLPARTGEATLTVAVRNDGPAYMWAGRAGEPRTYVWVKLPKGVEAVSLPEGCSKPNKGDWGKETFPGDFRCGDQLTDIRPGESMGFEIPVRITAVDLAAEGAVIVARDFGGDRQERYDLNAATDTAAIAFEGGTGGDGGGLADTGTTAGVVAAVGAAALVAGFVAFRAFRRRANASGYYGSADE